MGASSILHLNLVGIMAAVEETLDHTLKCRPFVVGNRGSRRAIVLDISSEAHRAGIRRGMGLEAARRLLPGLRELPPRHDLYARADGELFRIASDFSPLVERAGSGHLFVDFRGTRGLWGEPEDGASKLRQRVLDETGLLPSITLASTKMASKVATRVMRPSGFLVLGYGEEVALIRNQPVGLLPGVGPLLLERLGLLEISDIGELADLDEEASRAIGPQGPALRNRAAGLEKAAVNPAPPERRRISGSLILEPDSGDPLVIAQRASALASELGFAMRRDGFGAHRVEFRLSFADGASSASSARFSRPLSRDDELARALGPLLARARDRRVRVRSIGIELGEFAAAGPELDLFTPEEGRRDHLQAAVDKIRLRYGLPAIAPAVSLAMAPTRDLR